MGKTSVPPTITARPLPEVEADIATAVAQLQVLRAEQATVSFAARSLATVKTQAYQDKLDALYGEKRLACSAAGHASRDHNGDRFTRPQHCSREHRRGAALIAGLFADPGEG